MKRTLVMASVLALGMIWTFGGQAKRSTCATLKDGKGQVVHIKRGLPPIVWKADGTCANCDAVEKAIARSIMADPTLSKAYKDAVVSLPTQRAIEAELSNPSWRDRENQPQKKGGGGGEGCCPCLGQTCKCWGTMIGGPVLSCENATLDCREVSPSCPL